MSIASSLWTHPLRLTSLILVLAGATTLVGACNSGEVSGDEQAALAKQGLNFAGDCVCLPIASCPTATTGCVRAPTALDRCQSTTTCRTGTSYCYVLPDGKGCTASDLTKTTCDGGYCGTCPGCYAAKTGLCAAGTEVAACGVGAVACADCNDGNECTKDICSTGRCLSSTVGNGTACTGGTCWSGKCCTGCLLSGSCQAGTAAAACGTSGIDCSVCPASTNPCIKSYCGTTGCVAENVALGTACSDGNLCNGDETCDGNGKCLSGTAKDCTSSDPCFESKCDNKLGCVASPRPGVSCNDGDLCTVGDACDVGGKCVGGARKPCDDGKNCTNNDCNPTTGNCLNTPLSNNTPCDDGAACTTGETCQSGICTPAGMVPCDDGTFCTKDNITCPSGACSSDPVAMDGQLCVPTNKCVYNGTCNNGTCGGGTPVNCDDGNPCTTDDCDPATGCTHTNEPVTTLCIDGNPCTTEDHCRPVTGKCQGVATVCAALDDCHAPGTCDSATGRCDDPRRVDGFPCANTTGRCASGVCQFDAVGAAGAPGVAGSAGVPVGSGGSTSTTGTAGSTAVGGTSAKGGTTADAGDVYQRNPGGCNCNLPGRSSSSRLALLGLLGLARGFARRRRSPR